MNHNSTMPMHLNMLVFAAQKLMLNRNLPGGGRRGGSIWRPPCGFSKNVSSKEGWNSGFLWLLILS